MGLIDLQMAAFFAEKVKEYNIIIDDLNSEYCECFSTGRLSDAYQLLHQMKNCTTIKSYYRVFIAQVKTKYLETPELIEVIADE